MAHRFADVEHYTTTSGPGLENVARLGRPFSSGERLSDKSVGAHEQIVANPGMEGTGGRLHSQLQPREAIQKAQASQTETWLESFA